MNFQHLDYLPYLLAAILLLIISIIWLESKFFKMVRLYWFYKRSFFSYLSSFFLVIGLGFLLLSLLDLRGPEEKIKAGVPTERTIILIDTSASMLAEDVKPSRLQKAVLIAKHFARKAAGQQMSIVAFAEIQKKIVPFTNDLDLIDSRLESIKLLRNQNGSSALSKAIQESLQYFKETGDGHGNLLVLTDGEETAEDIDINMPKEVHLALVGVGTSQGGRIPLDDGHGFRFGYKKNKGSDVITKLNEKFFKQIAADVPSGEYWLANSYNFPTDEILEFFKAEKSKGDKQQDMVIRPVLMEYLVLPGLLFLILAYFFKFIKVFSLSLIFLVMPLRAEEPIELSPEVITRLDQLKNGELNQLQKIKLADDLLRAGAKDEALVIYEENLPPTHGRENIPPEAYLNYGTGLLQKGDAQKGFEVYNNLLETLSDESAKKKEIKETIEKNVLSFFKNQKQKQEKQKKEDQDKKNQKQNQSGEGSSQGSSGQQQNQQQNKGNQDQKDQKDQNKQDKSEQDKEQKDKADQGDEEKEKEQDQPKDQQGEKKPLPPQKLEPKLKQLMSDDRQLQLKIIEQGTREMNRRQNRANKDW